MSSIVANFRTVSLRTASLRSCKQATSSTIYSFHPISKRIKRQLPMEQKRFASTEPISLATLSPRVPKKPIKRLGRGRRSGHGKTSGRGQKGQKARGGKSRRPGFQGGQTSIIKQIPKHGFVNARKSIFVRVNLQSIQDWIDKGKLDPTKPITIRELFSKKLLSNNIRDGVILLARGANDLKQPIDIVVSRASALAIQRIENIGGTIVCKYYNRLSLRHLTKPEKFIGKIPPRDADPVSRKDIEYYSNWQKRGYLAIQEKLRQIKGLPALTKKPKSSAYIRENVN